MCRLFLLLLLCSANTFADYTLSVDANAKYSETFKHFDYVNLKAPRGGAIAIPTIGYFDSLYPYGIKSNYAIATNQLLYDTLMEQSLDEPLTVYPLVAMDVVTSSDGLSVRFTLHPDARFADGSPITTRDVKASFELLTSEHGHPRYKNYFADVKTIGVVSDSVISFNFAKKNPELSLIIATALPIISKKWIDGNKQDALYRVTPLSSGPYEVEDYDIGKYISYKRNDDYWAWQLPTRRGTYNFSAITFKYFRNPDVAQTSLSAGDVDWYREFNSKSWATKYNGARYQSKELIKGSFVHNNNNGMQGFAFNLRRKKLQDIKVRKAIALVFDFTWANQHLFYGQYKQSVSYFSNSDYAALVAPSAKERKELQNILINLPYSSVEELLKQKDDLSLSRSDRLHKAAQLLKEAQIDDLQLHIILAQKGFERILHRFAYYLSLVGVTLTYRSVDYALYQERVNSYDYDMIVTTFPSGERPGNELLNFFHSSSSKKPNQFNFTGIANQAIDHLIGRVISANTNQKLRQATANLDRVLMSMWLMVPNWHLNYHRIAYSKDLSYPKTLPRYYSDLNWALLAWWRKK